MNLSELKKSFESVIQPDPLQPIVECSLAWAYFKAFLLQFPEGEEWDEFGVSFSFANINDGITSRTDPNLFQVYFGRLIDAEKNIGWSTAEIDFYYHFEMNPRLSVLLAALPKEDVETNYGVSEGMPVIQQKMAEVMGFADQQTEIWNEIKQLKPILASYHFWVW
jgi:hypothetical protein